VVAALSAGQQKNLQSFSDWLDSREEYVYIVDAANVAYTRQNFENGRFSFRQVELVVKELQRMYPEERVLVVLPYPYAQYIVPNSVRGFQSTHRSAIPSNTIAMLPSYCSHSTALLQPYFSHTIVMVSSYQYPARSIIRL